MTITEIYQQALTVVKQCKSESIPAEWNPQIKLRLIESAIIEFSKPIADLSVLVRSRRFSHIDKLHDDHPANISATCVDEKNGAVFGVSTTARSIVLVPMYRYDPVSFADYYMMVRKKVDGEATIRLMSEYYKEDQDLKDYYCHAQRPRRYPWDSPD